MLLVREISTNRTRIYDNYLLVYVCDASFQTNQCDEATKDNVRRLSKIHVGTYSN